MSNINGLVTPNSVYGSGDPDSNFFIKKENPLVIDDLVANQIVTNELFLGQGELTTSNDGNTLLLNGVPVSGSGIQTITSNAPIGVLSTQTSAVIFLNNTPAVPGLYTNANVTINQFGLVTEISSGDAGVQNLSEVLLDGNSAGASQIDMNNNKIINCLNPTDPQDVATKQYVDDSVPGSDPLSVVLGIGNSAGTSNIDMNNNKIINVLDGEDNGDAVNYGQLINEVTNWATYEANAPINASQFTIQNVADPVEGTDATNKEWVLNEIQSVGSNWSTFPATQAVDIGNFTIENVADPIKNTDATNKQWVLGQIQSAGNVSDWSTFEAIQDVDMASNGLVNVANITNTTGDLDISASDVNISSTGLTSLDISSSASASLSATLGVTVQAGGAVNITAGAGVSLTAIGSVNIGSSNVGGTFTSIEKVGINENVIFADGGGPLQLKDIISINNNTTTAQPVTFGASNNVDLQNASIVLKGALCFDASNQENTIVFYNETSGVPPTIVAGGCQVVFYPNTGYCTSSVGFQTLGDFEIFEDFDLKGEGDGFARIRSLVTGGTRLIVVGLTSISGNIIIQGGDGTSGIPSIDLNPAIEVNTITSVNEGVVRILEPLDVTGDITATGSITGGNVVLTGTEGTNTITNVGTLETILLKTDVIQLQDTVGQTYIEALDSIQFAPEKELRFQNDIQIISEEGGNVIVDVPSVPPATVIDTVLAFDVINKRVYYQPVSPVAGISIDPTNYTTASPPTSYISNTIYKIEPLVNFDPINLPAGVLNVNVTIKNTSATHKLRINDDTGTLIIDTVAGESLLLIYDGTSWVTL